MLSKQVSRRYSNYSLFAFCAIAPALSLYCLLGLYVDYFFWDEWNLLVRFSTYIFYRSPHAWDILWEPHFSHRLVLLKLLSAANFHLFGGESAAFTVAGVACAGRTAFCFGDREAHAFRTISPVCRRLRLSVTSPLLSRYDSRLGVAGWTSATAHYTIFLLGNDSSRPNRPRFKLDRDFVSRRSLHVLFW
jgi:hypothetical protein